MADAKPVASLTPTLLARKGGARPVLRAQVAASDEAETSDRISAAMRAKDDAGDKVVALDTMRTVAPAAKAQTVRRQRERLAEELAAPRRARPAPAEAPARTRPAAFTLRLDADRHLKLRLASALTNRSAQNLVIEALDSMLANLPEVAELASRAGKR